MFARAIRRRDYWELSNDCDDLLHLTCPSTLTGGSAAIGTLGTAWRDDIRIPQGLPTTKPELVAEMLAALHPYKHFYLIDVRRDGVGAHSNWGPLQFATQVPERLAGRATYAFYHVPCLAPS